MEWGLIADDLTGGLDTGVAFVGRGVTQLRLPGAPDPKAPPATLILDTESRALSARDAAACAAAAAAKLRAGRAARVYKKIDSTLRGPWAAELEAVRQALAVPTVLIAPAFPALGRGTRGGRVYVGGVPLEATPLQTSSRLLDHLAPLNVAVTPLHVTDLRAGETALASRLAAEREAGTAYVVADAERDDDLAILARAAARAGVDRLSCGSGGMAAAWATLDGAPVSPRCEPLPRPCLVVAASRHPVTHRQVSRLATEGRPAVFWWSAAGSEQEAARLVTDLGVALRAGRTGLIATEATSGPAMPEVVARIALALAAGLEQSRPGSLLLTGGETAYRVLSAAGAEGVRLEGLCRPGIPRGVIEGGAWDGVALVTKAGGFGDEEALVRLVGA